ncbi:MAG: hypothetical protein ACE3L7_19815 [Candidatus Pristimantibacillus sp.]
MKRKVSTGVLIALLIAVGVYIYADNTIVKETDLESDHAIFKNYNEALEKSDVVLEVTATSDSQNILDNQDDAVTTGHTITTVKINKVFENKTVHEVGLTLESGAAIEILEPTYTVNNGIEPGVTRFNYEDYTKMIPNIDYVLFLKWDDSRGAYWVNSLEQGKFNLDNQDTKEISVAGSKEQYEKLKEDVLNNLYR